MNVTNETWTVQLFEPDPNSAFTIERLAQLANARRHEIGVYWKYGLISPIENPDGGGPSFGEDAVRTIRQIQELQQDWGINLAGIRMIIGLVKELERLRNEMRFLRQ